MNPSRKLKEWQRENLIDATTAERIAQYEKSRARPVVLWAVGALGAFAIVVGVVSVIAANWLYTPDWVKLAVDLLICLLVAAALYARVGSERGATDKLWLREVLVIFYYGFTLASMGLIAQTYQLGGSLATLLLVWTVATLPLVLLGRGKILAALWTIGSATTWVLNMEPLFDFAKSVIENEDAAEALVLSLLLMAPIVFMLVSRIPWLVQHRPAAAGIVSGMSWLAIVVFGWLCQFLWYSNISPGDRSVLAYTVGWCLIGVAATVYCIPRLYRDSARDSQLAMRVTLLAVFVLGASAVWHDRSLDLAGALTNVAYLVVLGWAAMKIHSTLLFNTVTALICVRILVIYFEVFGSMLQTGIGLIVGGVLTLLTAWWWFRKSGALAERLGLAGR